MVCFTKILMPAMGIILRIINRQYFCAEVPLDCQKVVDTIESDIQFFQFSERSTDEKRHHETLACSSGQVPAVGAHLLFGQKNK